MNKNNLQDLIYEYILKSNAEQSALRGDIVDVKSVMQSMQDQIKSLSAFMNRPNSYDSSCDEFGTQDTIHHKHFLEYIKTGQINQSMIEKKDMHGGCDGDDCKNGGYLVSHLLNRDIITISEEANVFRKLAKVRQVRGDKNEYLQVLDKIGDLGWVGETDDRNSNYKTPSLNKITIPLFEMYAQPRVTKNLLINDSSIDIYSWLRDEIADAFSETELMAFMYGKGISSPMGLFSDEARLERVQSGSTKITFDDILNLYNSLDPRYRSDACFVMSPKMQSLIYTLQDKNGNFISQHSFVDKTPDRLFGLPVYLCNSMDSGDKSGHMPIIFGNFKLGYLILDCNINTFIRDDITEKQWVKFYTTKRVGASVIDGNALKILSVK